MTDARLESSNERLYVDGTNIYWTTSRLGGQPTLEIEEENGPGVHDWVCLSRDQAKALRDYLNRTLPDQPTAVETRAGVREVGDAVEASLKIDIVSDTEEKIIAARNAVRDAVLEVPATHDVMVIIYDSASDLNGRPQS